jgi:wobble nucleotide-excising tRNase
MTIYKGSETKITATFTADNVATNTTVTATVQDPDGTVTNPSVSNTATGVYEFDLLLNKAGRWIVKVAGSGDVNAVIQNTISVTDTI